jgi:tetratricopeptide (TPR) repeat protein
LYAIEEAVQHLQRGVKAAEGAGVFTYLMYCTGQLAWAYWLLQETARARALAEQAEAIFQQITVPAGRAFLLGVHAYVAVARVRLVDGEAERAREILSPVLAAAEACGWQEAIAYGALVVGQCLAACGDERGAESALQRALQVTLEVSLPGVAWQVHAALADFHRAAKRFEAAEHHWAQAKALIERLAITLDDEAIRHGFLNFALSNWAECHFNSGVR